MFVKPAVFVVLPALIAGCLLGVGQSVRADQVFGVTASQSLVNWDSATPGTVSAGVAITGLQVNEQIVGIDFRPLDGLLYGVGNQNRFYRINTNTGAVTQIGANFPTSLVGSLFGFDFNPTIDRSRIDSDLDKNYVINPSTGGQTVATDLFYQAGDANFGANPNVVHIGYNNNFSGALTSQLYGIDSGLDILVTQANSAGTLGTVGSLGLNISGIGGFDISSTSTIAFGAFQLEGNPLSNFYQINLANGSTTSIGQIGGGQAITAIAVAIPEPSSLMITGMSLLSCLLVRRKRHFSGQLAR